MTKDTKKLNEQEMDQVAGGFFIPNPSDIVKTIKDVKVIFSSGKKQPEQQPQSTPTTPTTPTTNGGHNTVNNSAGNGSKNINSGKDTNIHDLSM